MNSVILHQYRGCVNRVTPWEDLRYSNTQIQN